MYRLLYGVEDGGCVDDDDIINVVLYIIWSLWLVRYLLSFDIHDISSLASSALGERIGGNQEIYGW